ncbi:MAG: transposase [Oscillospiraceae bacterium]|nr:transposase [Oscillospiraceae bacterium]
MRKRMRLESHDYSSAGYYFVTICTKDKGDILGTIVGANCVRPDLSKYGELVEKEISTLSATYDFVRVNKYVIMPNHIHMIIVLDDCHGNSAGRTQFAPTISRVIKQFKGAITKQIGQSMWQRSFHDHIIRSNADYQRIWQYIDENPERWTEDCYYSK